MFLTTSTDPYKVLTIISVISTLLTLSRLYWLLKSQKLASCQTEDGGNATRHPTFQKLEQTLSQHLIQAVLEKFHEIESMDVQGDNLLSVSDERIMSYASLLIQLRKTEHSTIEIRHVNAKSC